MMKYINANVLLILVSLSLCSFVQADDDISNDQVFYNSIAKIAAICSVYTERTMTELEASNDYVTQSNWWNSFTKDWFADDPVAYVTMRQAVTDYIDSKETTLAIIETVALDCIGIRDELIILTKAKPEN